MTTREDASLYLQMLARADRAQDHAPRPQSAGGLPPHLSGAEGRALRVLRRRNGSPAVILATLVLSVLLTLLAAAMATHVRGQEQLAHYTHTLQLWQVDAYSCAAVVTLTAIAWTALLALVARRIEHNRGVPPSRP
jgi:hypothetical protein